MKQIEKYLISLEGYKNKCFGLFFVLLVIIVAFMVYFFQWGYVFQGHDTDFHILRLEALMEAMKDGRFPVYIDHDAIKGYGYPTRWFYPDAILIPFAILGNVTDAIYAYKTLLLVMTILCGVFMYITVIRIYKSTYVAVTGSLLYTFSFYRMQDLFERSALGEAVSFTFVPLVFLGLYEIIKGNYKRWYILALGFTLLIFTHVLSMFLTFLTLLLVIAVYYKPLWRDKKRIYYLLFSGVVTFVTSAYFLFPLMEQLLSNTFYFTVKPLFHTSDFAVDIRVMLLGLSIMNFFPNLNNTGAFWACLGILLGISLILRLFLREKSDTIKDVDTGVYIGLFYLIISLNIFPWGMYPFTKLNFICFPWRLYEFATYFFSIAGGYYSYRLFRSYKHRIFAILFIVAITLISLYTASFATKADFKAYNPYKYEKLADRFYSTGALEYVPHKVPSIKYMDARGDSIGLRYKETLVSNFSRSKGSISFDVDTRGKKESIELPLFYYKGYHAEIDGEKIPLKESKNGLLELTDVDHSGKIKILFSGTPIQRISPYVSLISLLVLIIYICWDYYHSKTKAAKKNKKGSV
ncbi:MAG: hypothetical protein LBP34_04700 [Flavobacteriaceae bacterium]|jgi:hypothetical protein|nr:hypothetical protein [Flavobacteriaceae bacterium]